MSTETPRTDGALARLARFCYRRRRLVLLAWIVGVLALVFVGFRYGAPSDNEYSGGESHSARAQALIEQHFPEQQGDTLTLAIKAENGIDDPAARQKIEQVIADLEASPVTGPVTSPYEDESLVTQDRRIARTTIPLTDIEVEKSEVKPLVDIVKDASGDGLTLGLGGDKAEKAETPPQGPAEGVGLLAAAVILFIAFGSLVAMGLPIVTGLMAVLGGIALMKLVGHVVPSPDFTVLVAGLLGLGVGIDYALFILTRYKDGLQEGSEPESATVKAITTAGHAVLFAGTTVVIALLGLIVMGQQMMTGVAVGASVAVLVTMIAAVTLVPAFLGFAGHRINSLRLPRRTSRRHAAAGVPARERRTPAERWAGAVQRMPLIAAILAGAILLVLAVARVVDAAEPARRQRPAPRPEQLHLVRDHLRGLRTRLWRTHDLRYRGRLPGRRSDGPVVEAVRNTDGHRLRHPAPGQHGRAGRHLHGLPRDRISRTRRPRTWCTSSATTCCPTRPAATRSTSAVRTPARSTSPRTPARACP